MPSDDADVLIIGSGILGSAVARLLREADPRLQLVMVDGGRPIGATPGLHLHDVPEPEIWGAYNARVSTGVQGFYAGASPQPTAARDPADLEPGMHLLSALREEAAAMPMAAAAFDVGGMGVHWTAATPWPAGEEVFDFGDPEGWVRDLTTAQRVLGVTPEPFPPTAPGRHVLEVLRRRFAGTGAPDRDPRPMPMAAMRTPEGRLERTGPSRIFPPLGTGDDDRFRLMARRLAVRLDHDGHRVRGAVVRDLGTGERRLISARTTIVCADSFRTPQLLHASGIRPDALGRYLNEHAFLTGRVLLDLDRAGLTLADLPAVREDEFATDSLWLPQNGPAQPFHGQIMDTTYVDEAGAPLAHGVAVSLYSPVASNAEHRMRFLDGQTDLFAQPRYRVEYGLTPGDEAVLEEARATHAELFRLFGDFDPETESALLPAGSSLHPTGTVRAGAEDDGGSVTDPDGRVWGFANLFLAGNGVIPTAMVANTTLTATITGVRAARAALRRLEHLDA